MGESAKELRSETEHLEEILNFIEGKLEEEKNKMIKQREDLIAERRHMYENTAHSALDLDKLSDMVQHLTPLNRQTWDYEATTKNLQKYEKLLNSPYFARIDFYEEGFGKEKIYIGLGNLMEDETGDILIYDWRSPIASIFYRYELGEASYQAPFGKIKGQVDLKRQYEITNGKLQYFFDSNVSVMDDLLKKALSDNASTQMKAIVETIQREQDIIIRDIENELVIVQGVAGSGKTSVALHRVAFLMYQGLTEKLRASNIIMISPNTLFGQYISKVLPEMGEENISTVTFEAIAEAFFDNTIKIKSRNALLEEIITEKDQKKRKLIKTNMEFKLSNTFVVLLERYIQYYQHKMIEFKDIYYNNELVADRHLLKAELLRKDKRSIPLEKRLAQMEKSILNRMQEIKGDRIKKIQEVVYRVGKHPFDIKSFSRLMAVKEAAPLRKSIYQFTRLDYLTLYRRLFEDKKLFYRLSAGLDLPQNIEEILDYTIEGFKEDEFTYEDTLPLMALKLKMAGCSSYADIKQVMVDEAQDYYPMHYEVLKMLFRNAKYTIVGDVNQTIEKLENLTIYDNIKSILNKDKSTTVHLTKSFRSSYEINTFSSKFIDHQTTIESFDRHGSVPEIISKPTAKELEEELLQEITKCKELGYGSIAILCKSMGQSVELYNRLKDKIDLGLVDGDTLESVEEVVIIPIYMAKGLEFDVVLVYGTDDENYSTEDDKKLLYIASTRALHKLTLYYTGEISRLL